MKRAIAMILSLIILSFSFVGCGKKDAGTVSDNTNGVIEDDTSARSGVTENNTSSAQDRQRERSIDDDIMDDVKGAIDDAGDAAQDIGRDIDDTLNGNNDSSKH